MRILFLTHRVPYAPNRGDRVRAFHILRDLARHAEVEVVALAHDQAELEQNSSVESLGVRSSAFLVPHMRNRFKALSRLPGRTPLTHLLLEAPGLRERLREIATHRTPDLVFAYCTGIVPLALEPPLDRFPLVVDFVDVDSEKWAEYARSTRGPRRWIYAREARTLASFERQVARRAAVSFVVNDREAAALKHVAPDSRIEVLLNGVEQRPPNGHGVAPQAAVAFCGVMNYGPNVDGVLWFARDVWPRIRAARPDARFLVIGSDPTPAIRSLAAEENGIEVTGTVPEVVSHLKRCAVSIAPLKTARGVQNKVLEAISLGLPAVVTSPVADGLPAPVLTACRRADAPDAFAKDVLELLALPDDRRRQLAASADLTALSWDRQLARLTAILSDATSRSGLQTTSKA